MIVECGRKILNTDWRHFNWRYLINNKELTFIIYYVLNTELTVLHVSFFLTTLRQILLH